MRMKSYTFVLTRTESNAQILLYYNFHVSLGDKTEKRYDLLALESPGVRIPH